MKPINTSCFLLLILLISFCKPSSIEENFTKVNLNFKDSGLSYEDFFETIELVELKFENDSNWIGNIDSYELANEELYVLDESQGKKIVKFDLSGQFLGEILSVGDAPVGFNKPSLLAVSKNDGQLVVFDRSLLKLIYYDSDLNYVKSEKVEEYFSNISFLEGKDRFIFFSESIDKLDNGYELAILKSGEAVKPLLFTEFQLIPYSSEAFFYNENSGFYHLPFVDKIYQFDFKSERFNPVLQVVLDENQIPSELLNSTDISEMNIHLSEKQTRYVTFNGVEYNDKYLFFYHDGFDSYGIASIEKNNVTNNLATSWEELFDHALIPVPFVSSDEYYYSIGYLSQNAFMEINQFLGLNSPTPEFSEFKEKLFVFKFKLK